MSEEKQGIPFIGWIKSRMEKDQQDHMLMKEAGFQDRPYDIFFIRLDLRSGYQLNLLDLIWAFLAFSNANLFFECVNHTVVCTGNVVYLPFTVYYFISMLYWDIRCDQASKSISMIKQNAEHDGKK